MRCTNGVGIFAQLGRILGGDKILGIYRLAYEG